MNDKHCYSNNHAALTIPQLTDALRPVWDAYTDKAVFAYVFGSVVTQKITPLSDIDLAFYMRPEFSGLSVKNALTADCMRVLQRNDLDIVMLNSLKNLVLAYSIIRGGMVLFDNDSIKREEYELSVSHRAMGFLTQRKAVMGV